MEAALIMNNIQQLPVTKQIYIAEWILKTIRKRENKSEMEIAADLLYNDYATNSELTSFTQLDFEHFYETAR